MACRCLFLCSLKISCSDMRPKSKAVAVSLHVGAILTICVSNLGNDRNGEENNLVFPIIWVLSKYFMGYYNLKNEGRKENLRFAKSYVIWIGNFKFKVVSIKQWEIFY